MLQHVAMQKPISGIVGNKRDLRSLASVHKKRVTQRICAAYNAVASGSLPSFAAQSTNGCNAENRPFAALVAKVSVADFSACR